MSLVPFIQGRNIHQSRALPGAIDISNYLSFPADTANSGVDTAGTQNGAFVLNDQSKRDDWKAAQPFM
jgi:hypothetical protein